MRASSLIFIVLTALAATSFTHPVAERKIRIVFHHTIGDQPLVLGEAVKNRVGDTLTLQRFRYYVSNFSIENANGVSLKSEPQYFLIDQEDSASQTITITVPQGAAQQLSFLLGVDSIRNVSGIQTGALDPMHGMFWTWNSGYVMAKLEGTSPAVHAPGNRFTFHVGGFRTGMNALKWIHLPLPATGNDVEEIHITADINHWFKGASELKIAETPVCHSPGALALRIADNYSSMFSINSVK